MSVDVYTASYFAIINSKMFVIISQKLNEATVYRRGNTGIFYEGRLLYVQHQSEENLVLIIIIIIIKNSRAVVPYINMNT